MHESPSRLSCFFAGACRQGPDLWTVGCAATPPIEVEGYEELEVEEVLDSRLFRRCPLYLVKWLGYNTDTWEPLNCPENALELMEKFHRQYPTKLGPW